MPSALDRLGVTGLQLLFSVHADHELDAIHRPRQVGPAASDGFTPERFIAELTAEINAGNIDEFLYADQLGIFDGPFFTSVSGDVSATKDAFERPERTPVCCSVCRTVRW